MRSRGFRTALLFALPAALAAVVWSCGGGGGSSTSTTPTTPTPTSRVVGLSGSLAFGNVTVGQAASLTLTITNSGDGPLTVSGVAVTSGLGSVYTSSFASGTIPAGGSQAATIQFSPTAATSYNGTLTVNGDQTSGTNTVPISGTGTTPASATFSLSGAVTDGISHGVLPNITVQIVSGTNAGRSAVTDTSGEYAMSGLSAGTFTLSAAATSYQTKTQPVSLSASVRVDLVLQRSTDPTPTPPTIPLSPTITAPDAFRLIQSNKGNPGLVIIDVRTAAEFSGGHIANAIHMDYYSPDFRSNIATLDRNNRYVVYCRTGIRGAAATQIMRDLSFTQTQNLTGGLEQWILDGYPTVM